MQKLQRMAQRRGTTLIDTNRARNLAITLRKIGLDTESICKAVYQYDLVQLPLEFVEMLPSFIPNDTEMKAIKVKSDYGSTPSIDWKCFIRLRE